MLHNQKAPTSEELLALTAAMKAGVNRLLVAAATKAVTESITYMLKMVLRRTLILTDQKELVPCMNLPESINGNIGESTLKFGFIYPHITVDIVFENGETFSTSGDLTNDKDDCSGVYARALYFLYWTFAKGGEAARKVSTDQQCAFIVDACIFDMHMALKSLDGVDITDCEAVKATGHAAVDKTRERLDEMREIVKGWNDHSET